MPFLLLVDRLALTVGVARAPVVRGRDRGTVAFATLPAWAATRRAVRGCVTGL